MKLLNFKSIFGTWNEGIFCTFIKNRQMIKILFIIERIQNIQTLYYIYFLNCFWFLKHFLDRCLQLSCIIT